MQKEAPAEVDMENKPRNLNIEDFHEMITELKSQIDKYNDILQYILGIEDRLAFVCKQNSAYKDRCMELTNALESMIIEHCSYVDHLDHRGIEANKTAFKVLGIKNGININDLEKLLERKLK